jgi:RNA polymerase sigma-70 factor (ECF subfamily)
MPDRPVDSIVEEVRAGRTEAFGEIVRLFQKDVWRVAAAMLHDLKTTEELVQQAFVDAYLHLDQYRIGEDFGAWVRAIARNLVRMELRRRGREERRLELYREALADRLRDDDAARHEERLEEALRKCRQTLPEHGARVLDLRYGQALDFEEIARSLGRSVEATRQLLSRLRLMLRDCLRKGMARA